MATKESPLLDGLPEEVVAILRGKRVLAWTTIDPDYDIVQYACCSSFGKFLILPCLWPHCVILSPCLLASCVGTVNLSYSQYWVLTETDLRIVHVDHDETCFPYCWRSGVSVRTIPLERISDVGLDSRGRGIGNRCAGDIPVISVETAAVNATKDKEVRGVGLRNHQWFIEQILCQIDVVRNSNRQPIVETRNNNNKSPLERVQELETMYERGYVSKFEYNQLRKEILQAI